MEKVYSLQEAMDWFLSHSEGSVLCCNGFDDCVCNSYPEAEKFYNLNK